MNDPDTNEDAELVARLVGQVIRNGPFPPPDPYTTGSNDAVWEITV